MKVPGSWLLEGFPFIPKVGPQTSSPGLGSPFLPGQLQHSGRTPAVRPKLKQSIYNTEALQTVMLIAQELP